MIYRNKNISTSTAIQNLTIITKETDGAERF